MQDSTGIEIKKLFLENEEFRKEFITNTKEICKKYGIVIGDDTPIEFRQTGELGQVKPMKCLCVNCSTPQGFIICDF